MKRFLLAAAMVAATSLTAHAQLTLTQIASVDLGNSANLATVIPSNTFGNNPYALAWDGTDAYVAGVGSNTGIIRISNAITAPAYGTVFGTTTSQITGLAVSGSNVYAASTPAGATSVRSFTSAGTLNWNITDATQRAEGVAINPGLNGTGTTAGGVSFLSNGAGRVRTLNATTGAYIANNTNGNGGVINFSPTATVWRDLAFDPATGDVYTRESNRIGKAVRIADSGGNAYSGTASTVLAPLTQTGAPGGQFQQSIAFMNTPNNGSLLVANDNNNGAIANFTDVVKFFTTSGTEVVPTWSFLSGTDVNGFNFFNPSGTKRYDFGYSATNNTLAVTDSANRRLYIFSAAAPVVVPETGTLSLLAVGFATLGGIVLKKRKAA
ncbi:MAG: hypothetical protein H7Y38_14880 [Armatimonadetes bacterium]|nr:hypothetical protein [Armatimonadota bacterium]